jgi:alpha-N-arabinofuranosidase
MYLGGCSGDDAPIDRCNEAGVTLYRNFFCQFAENLGRGLYDGIWVGPDSPIPNMCEIRNDVVAAASVEGAKFLLGGGCFADPHHWRKGIGPGMSFQLR